MFDSTGEYSIEDKALDLWEKGVYDAVLTLLVKSYGRELFRFCFSMLNSENDAEDALQHIFLNAYRGMPKYKGESSFRTWLYSIAGNCCKDKLKMNKRRSDRIQFVEAIPEDISDDRDDEEYVCLRSRKILQQCIGELGPEARSALLLRYQVGLSYNEISGVMPEKPNTLQARVARALKALRKCLENNGVAR